MRYLGGKARTYKEICAFLERIRLTDQVFVEPFCGACWVTQGMKGERHASDANGALVVLHKAMQDGWEPPKWISEEEYALYQQTQPTGDPLTAFVGFGCSFSGKWFGGYARDNSGRNYAANAASSLVKKNKTLKGVSFTHRGYSEAAPANALVYCDPPYASTTGYGAVGAFDSAEFWATMRAWAKANTVVVSEYAAPDDFVCVKAIGTKTDMHTKNGQEARVEKLFMHESQAGLAWI
jgi:DNA adenine methylase